MKMTFLGAAGEVTGSMTLVDTGKTRVLVDCGMIQGNGNHLRNFEPFPFDAASIDAVIVTHAHIDHIGRIPKLVKEGFDGRIFCTHPTRLLAKLMWQDAAQVMKDEARQGNRPALYLPKDIAAVYDLTHGMEYNAEVQVSGDVRFRLRESGHIFGSAFVELEAGGAHLVFSGDVGNEQVPILRDTAPIERGDIIITEGTYGDRIHDAAEQRTGHLAQAVRDTVARRGTLLIPAFSLERTQEILYELNGLVEAGAVPPVPMFLDSPLAIKILPIYKQFAQYYDRDAAALKKAGDDFFAFPGLHITKKPDESAAIVAVPPPKVIISGSGMMHGGRIMKHLTAYLDDPGTTLLVVGFQSIGTLGRRIAEGAQTVHIDHMPIDVRAKVETISAYSAHGDQNKICRWVASGPTEPKHIFINHAEPPAAAALAERMRREQHLTVTVPQAGESFEF